MNSSYLLLDFVNSGVCFQIYTPFLSIELNCVVIFSKTLVESLCSNSHRFRVWTALNQFQEVTCDFANIVMGSNMMLYFSRCATQIVIPQIITVPNPLTIEWRWEFWMFGEL